MFFFFMNETKSNVRNAIKDVISELMENVLDSVLVKNPFISERFHAEKPLYAALIPDEIFKGSHFERRFVTRFGNTWEKLAFVVANANMGGATLQAKIDGNILEGRLKRIQEILNAEDHGTKENKKRKPNWEEDLKYVLKGKGEPIPCQVVCDLLVEDKRINKKYAFELKAPLPNSDQTKVSKEKMLKLMSMDNHPIE